MFLALAFLFLGKALMIVPAKAQIIYEQRLSRADLSVSEAMNGTRGTIYLTNDSVTFKARKAGNERINFGLSYNQISSIRRVNPLLFPNRILIRLKDGEKYRLFTYRRRKIINEISRRLQ